MIPTKHKAEKPDDFRQVKPAYGSKTMSMLRIGETACCLSLYLALRKKPEPQMGGKWQA